MVNNQSHQDERVNRQQQNLNDLIHINTEILNTWLVDASNTYVFARDSEHEY